MGYGGPDRAGAERSGRVEPTGSAQSGRIVLFIFFEIFSCAKINPEISR
jgi:hypothetical protein